MRILLLGGTGEAFGLASRLAAVPSVDTVLSLAGRTVAPRTAPVPSRSGGFGGPDGLVLWLARNRIDLVVDATHPFAARISAHAAEACARTGVPLLALRRPPWRPLAGDRWTSVASMAEAAACLGTVPRRVFLAVGRLELGAFMAAPWHHYVVRTIEPVDPDLALPRLSLIQDRGPFRRESEERLMRQESIEVLVSKNSGSEATAAKLAAARALGLPVVMVKRPEKPAVESVADVDAALSRILSHRDALAARGV
jgi:precorrin-6A/cobalt-precorrin-6A reductase